MKLCIWIFFATNLILQTFSDFQCLQIQNYIQQQCVASENLIKPCAKCVLLKWQGYTLHGGVCLLAEVKPNLLGILLCFGWQLTNFKLTITCKNGVCLADLVITSQNVWYHVCENSVCADVHCLQHFLHPCVHRFILVCTNSAYERGYSRCVSKTHIPRARNCQ